MSKDFILPDTYHHNFRFLNASPSEYESQVVIRRNKLRYLIQLAGVQHVKYELSPIHLGTPDYLLSYSSQDEHQEGDRKLWPQADVKINQHKLLFNSRVSVSPLHYYARYIDEVLKGSLLEMSYKQNIGTPLDAKTFVDMGILGISRLCAQDGVPSKDSLGQDLLQTGTYALLGTALLQILNWRVNNQEGWGKGQLTDVFLSFRPVRFLLLCAILTTAIATPKEA